MRMTDVEARTVQALTDAASFPQLERIYTVASDEPGRFYMVCNGELFTVDIKKGDSK